MVQFILRRGRRGRGKQNYYGSASLLAVEVASHIRITNDGIVRLLEDGTERFIENNNPVVANVIIDQSYLGNTSPTVLNTIGVQVYQPS